MPTKLFVKPWVTSHHSTSFKQGVTEVVKFLAFSEQLIYRARKNQIN